MILVLLVFALKTWVLRLLDYVAVPGRTMALPLLQIWTTTGSTNTPPNQMSPSTKALICIMQSGRI